MAFHPDKLSEATIEDLTGQFETGHEQRYGFKVAMPVEIVTLRVLGKTTAGQPIPNAPSQDSVSNAVPAGEKRVYIGGADHNVPIYDRSSLRSGNKITGLALITQRDSSTHIHPDHLGKIDERLNLCIDLII